MAQYTAEVIVLGVKNWGEADKMLQFFSREGGRIKAAAFGCRRPKSPLAGGLQMFNELDVTLVSGERVDTVRQCSVKRRFSNLESDLVAMAHASLVAESVVSVMPEGSPQPEVYDWLVDVLAAFGPRTPRLVSLAALVQLLDFSGVGFSYDACVKCGEPICDGAVFSASEGGALFARCADGAENAVPYPLTLARLLSTLASIDWKAPPSFRARREDIEAAEKIVLSAVQDLIGRKLRSLKFIRQIGA